MKTKKCISASPIGPDRYTDRDINKKRQLKIFFVSLQKQLTMKKGLFLFIFVFAACITAQAQTYTTFGIGIDNPNGTLHVHSSENLSFPPWPNIPIYPEGGRNEIYGDFRTTLRMTNSKTSANDTDGFYIEQYNRRLTMSQLENAPFIMKNHQAMLILTPSGRIGIGDTSSDYYMLNVNGSVRVKNGMTIGGPVNMTKGISISSSLGLISLDTTGSAFLSRQLWVGDGFHCDPWGNLKVKSLRVTLTDWSDFVFDDGYRPMPLGEVERYINAHGHLPAVPSAREVEENGVDVGEMNKLLLQKVEELTLYVIDLQKQIDELKSKK